MPNLKSGTLVDPDELEETVSKLKAGRIEVRANNSSMICTSIGKRRFTKEQLLKNFEALVSSVQSMKPEKIKGKYFKS